VQEDERGTGGKKNMGKEARSEALGFLKLDWIGKKGKRRVRLRSLTVLCRGVVCVKHLAAE